MEVPMAEPCSNWVTNNLRPSRNGNQGFLQDVGAQGFELLPPGTLFVAPPEAVKKSVFHFGILSTGTNIQIFKSGGIASIISNPLPT